MGELKATKVTLYIAPEVVKALRLRSVEEGRTMSEITERALRKEVGLGENPAAMEKLRSWLMSGLARTRYTRRGVTHEALWLPWEMVTALLGRPHAGDGEDDKVLVAALLAAGAPAWVRDAEGWVDEKGWGLIGPALEEKPVVVRIPAQEAISHLWAGSEEPSWLVVSREGKHEWRWGRRPSTPAGGWVIKGPEWEWEGPDPEPEGLVLEAAELEQVRIWASEVEEAESGLRIEIGG